MLRTLEYIIERWIIKRKKKNEKKDERKDKMDNFLRKRLLKNDDNN